MSQIDAIFTLITQRHLDVETLQIRNADSLDFRDTAIWCLKDALEAVLKADVEFGASSPKAMEGEIAKDWWESRQVE